MYTYKNLEVYQIAHRLAVEIHNMTLKLPSFEMYEEGSQIRKSSKSVASNIVEGFGRRKYQSDYINFLVYAHSSCDETREKIKVFTDILLRIMRSSAKRLIDFFRHFSLCAGHEACSMKLGAHSLWREACSLLLT